MANHRQAVAFLTTPHSVLRIRALWVGSGQSMRDDVADEVTTLSTGLQITMIPGGLQQRLARETDQQTTVKRHLQKEHRTES
jgi:hypothetical protein